MPAWGGLTYLRLTKETTYGVYDAAQHLTSNEIWIRLEGDNPFGMRPTPTFYTIRGADGKNRRVITGNPRYTLAGNLNASLYPTQAQFLLDWASTLTSNDLPSVTIDYFDGVRSRAYLGVKVDQLALSCASADDPAVKAVFTLTGQAIAASNANFVVPVATDFPSSTPYVHQELAGGLTIGTSRTKFKSLNVTLKNMLSKPFDENAFISNCFWSGRDCDLTAALQYLAATDRNTLETAPNPTALTMTVVWTKASPAHTLTLTFESNNFLMAVDDEIPLGGPVYETLHMSTYFDRTAGTDFAFATT